MSPRAVTFLFAIPFVAALAAPARAKPAAVAEATGTALPKPFQLTVGTLYMPNGIVLSHASGEDSSGPAKIAIGIVPAFDARISRHLTLGVAFPIIFNVQQQGMLQDPSKELDMVLRLGAWLPLGPRARFFGTAGPGLYMIRQPRDQSPSGVLVSLGGGLTMDLTDRWYVYGETGVQAGLNVLGHENPESAYPVATAYWRTGLGAGMSF
jgi:hypothetical protein